MTHDTMDETDAVSEYSNSLADLTFNSKPLINMLTMLADDYKDTRAADIVRCIEQQLHRAPAEKKLPLLYLTDSICKNIGQTYAKLFTQNIVSNFCDVFEKVDERTRLSMYKLRQTWNSIFPARKLYAIDVRIHEKHDPAWPITAPKPSVDPTNAGGGQKLPSVVVSKANKTTNSSSSGGGHHPVTSSQQQVHINPRFFETKSQTLTNQLAAGQTGSDPDLAKQLLQKQQELLHLQRQKIELEMISKKKMLDEQARALQEKEQKLKAKEEQLQRTTTATSPVNQQSKKPKKRKRTPVSSNRNRRSPSPTHTSPSRSRISSRSPSDRDMRDQRDLRELRDPRQHRDFNNKSHQQPTANNQRQQQVVNQMNQQNKMNQQQLNQQLNQFVMPGLSQDNVLQSGRVSTGGQVQVPLINSISPMTSMNSLTTPQSHLSSHLTPQTLPTTIPAPTILAQPEMLNVMAKPSSATSTINVLGTFPVAPGISAITQPFGSARGSMNLQQNLQPSPWSRDRDYRREQYDSMISQAHEKLRAGVINSTEHGLLVREVEKTIRELMPAGLVQPPLATVTIAQPNDSLTVRIDKEIRKLFYLDETTAVVLLKAPPDAPFDQLKDMDPAALDPRQIMFEGHPSKVLIDDHDCIVLEFNGQAKTFFHKDHEQRIQFGGPAREIILNGQAYQALFGGPPIEVMLTGDSQRTHLLRLVGPEPRVKLSEQPRYDLWRQVVTGAVAQSFVKSVPKTTKEPINSCSSNTTATSNSMMSSSESQLPLPLLPDLNSLMARLRATGLIRDQPLATATNKDKDNDGHSIVTPNSQVNVKITNDNNSNSNFVKQKHKKQKLKSSSEQPKSDHRTDHQTNVETIALTPESLRVVRKKVVKNLYVGVQCTNCSLRFDERKKGKNKNQQQSSSPAEELDKNSKYSKHLDWHFRLNRRDKTRPSASNQIQRRSWYYPLDLWCLFKEVTDEEEPVSNVFAVQNDQLPLIEETITSTVASSDNELLNVCGVCGEKFELEWNEDEEEWRLKNAQQHTDERNYHPFCLADFVTQQQRQLNEENAEAEAEALRESENADLAGGEEEEAGDKEPEESMETSEEQTDDKTIEKAKVTSDEVQSEPTEPEETQRLLSDEVLGGGEQLSESKPKEDESASMETEEHHFKVIEFEIPLNDMISVEEPSSSDAKESDQLLGDEQRDRDSDQQQSDVQTDELTTCQSPTASTSVSTTVTSSPDKIVLQQGGFTITMKASNLPQPSQASQPQPSPAEEAEEAPTTTSESEQRQREQSDVIVKGHELSALCTIM